MKDEFKLNMKNQLLKIFREEELDESIIHDLQQ